jgi:hypothetical protein
MNTRYLSVVFSLFLIMTTVYVPAEAAGTDTKLDTKLYAGATCVPTADPHVHGGGDAQGAIFNSSKEELSVFCLVVRDVSRGQEIGVEKITIWVLDQHPDDEIDIAVDPDNVFCSFNSVDNPRSGFSLVGRGEVASKGASPDVQELEIFGQVQAIASASRGYYFIQCRIPAPVGDEISGIIAYEVVERQ